MPNINKIKFSKAVQSPIDFINTLFKELGYTVDHTNNPTGDVLPIITICKEYPKTPQDVYNFINKINEVTDLNLVFFESKEYMEEDLYFPFNSEDKKFGGEIYLPKKDSDKKCEEFSTHYQLGYSDEDHGLFYE